MVNIPTLFEMILWNCRDNFENEVSKACMLTLFEMICNFSEQI